MEIATMYIEKLGGKNNIQNVDCCITRLRLIVKDATIISDDEIMALGALRIIRLSDTNIQLVIGTNVDLIADEMQRILLS